MTSSGPLRVDTEQFLRTVVSTSEGHFCLLIGALSNGHKYHEEWFNWPQDVEQIVSRAEEASKTANVYFSSYLFSQPDSHKKYVLPSRTIQADLDAADVLRLEVRPTVLIETSPGRHQGYWILKSTLSLEEHERLSKQVSYSIQDCDRSGWPAGHRVRLPGTWNYKYAVPQGVRVVELTLERYTAEHLQESFPHVPTHTRPPDYDTWLENLPTLEIGPQELFAKYKGKVPRKVVAYFNNLSPDRSAALWGLMRACFRAGASRDEVYWLAKHSANNKFATDLKYNQDRDLAKDVLRAERASIDASQTDDLQAAFNEIRKLPGLQSEKRAFMSQTVIEILSAEGEFVESDDGNTWYLHNVSGRPILLGRSSQYLEALCESKFGLNASEPEYRYVVSSLMTHTHTRGKVVQTGSLSHYNRDSDTLLLHGGKKDIYAVTKGGISKHPNGTFNVMFPWRLGDEAFALEEPLDDWTETLFEGYFGNVVGLTYDQARVLFKVWIMFIMFRNAAVSRPILALFGQPGSGKSTLFRLIYTLLYGPRKGLSSVTNPEDFDHAVSIDPFVVLDNVDTWSSWLPDRLALAAATSDITKRKLYTDADTIILKRQAVVGISAHNPRFGREDVIDRLLLVNFQRLTEFKAETDLLDKVWRLRNRVWGSIVQDVQKCLAIPLPKSSEVPTFRIKDFALYGTWIARATGCETAFREAIEGTRTSQTGFTLNEEGVLIDSIQRWHMKRKAEAVGQKHTAGELWSILSSHTADPVGFVRSYKNSVSFGKKLWTLQESLRTTFDIQQSSDSQGRRWSIEPRGETT